MHINPSHVSVAGLLGGPLPFQMPQFQRNYAWTPDETGALLRDLDLCISARRRDPAVRRHHFFGGIVTAPATVQGRTRQRLEVIDGQQRLATFLMLAVQLKYVMGHVAGTLDDGAGHRPLCIGGWCGNFGLGFVV